MVLETPQRKQKVGESIQIRHDFGAHDIRSCERDHPSLSSSADRARHVESRRPRGTTREYERPELRKLRIGLVHPRFHLGRAGHRKSRGFGSNPALPGWRRREVRSQRE